MLKRSLAVKILILLAIWGTLAWTSKSGRLRFLEGPHEDLLWQLRWRILGALPTPPRVLVFPITRTFLEKGRAGEWIPWPIPRSYYAQAIRRLSELGVAAIGFDVLFPPQSSTGDLEELVAAIRDSRAPVILSGELQNTVGVISADPARPDDDEEGYSFDQVAGEVLMPNPMLASVCAGVGMVNLEKSINEDDVIRRHPLSFQVGGRMFPSLALKTYLAWKGLAGEPVLEGSNLRLPDGQLVPLERLATATSLGSEWAANPVWEKSALEIGIGRFLVADFGSLVDPLKDLGDPSRFKGTIALIGVDSDLLGDTIRVPGNPVAPGVLLHATFLDALTRTGFMTRLDQGWLASLPEAVLLGMCALGLLAESTLPTLTGILVNLGMMGLAEGMALLLFLAGYLIRVGPVLAGFPLALLGVYATGYFFEGREKNMIREIFGKQVSPDVVRTLLENPNAALTPRRQEITVCFIDVCGFTSFSEKHSAERVLVQLNYYFSQLMRIIHSNHGSLDKFIGDAMMITTGAPIASAEHALQMVKIALAIVEKIDHINQNLPAGIHPFQVSIGINSGEAVMGNVGSAERMEYTVIGDTVNLASRLQGKAGRQEIIIGPRTFALLGEKIAVESLEPFLVKGKDTPIQAYRVIGFQTQGNAKEIESGA